MSISSSDIQKLLSGGASNANPILSLGGVKSSVAVTGASIFDNISVVELAAGSVEYRGFYVQNVHATLTATNLTAWINSNTPSNLTDVALGLGTSAISGTEQTVANETTAPVGVTFFAAASKAAGLALGSLAPGQSKFVWVRRSASAGAVSSAVSDPFTIRLEAETL